MLSSVVRQTVRPLGVRSFASQASMLRATPADPKVESSRFLNSIPGNNFMTKTGVVAVGAGAAVFAVSKELFLLHPETIVLGCFAGMVYYLSGIVSPLVKTELDNRATEIRKQLNASTEAERNAILADIEAIKDSRVAVPVAQELFSLQRDIVQLQKQLKERQMRQTITLSIKQQLDYLANLEAQQRAAEQGDVLAALRERVLQAIKDPKFQDSLLKKAVSDIESLSIAK